MGVSVDEDSVRAAVIRHGQVLLTAASPIPSGAVSDGEIVDARAVAAALVEMWRVHAIGSRRVHLSIVSSRCDLQPVALPRPRDEDDLPRLIVNNHSSPVVNPVLTYAIIDDSHPNALSLAIGAAPTALVSGYQRLTRLANLEPVAVSFAAAALGQSMQASMRRDGLFGVIHIGRTRSWGAVYNRRIPLAQTPLDGGWDAVFERWGDPAAGPELLARVGYTDVPLSESIDIEHFITTQSNLLIASDLLRRQVAETVELAQARGYDLERVLVCGPYADTPGLTSMLADGVPVPVERLLPRDGLEGDDDFSADAVALGACYQPLMSLLDVDVDATITAGVSNTQALHERRAAGRVAEARTAGRLTDGEVRSSRDQRLSTPRLLGIAALAVTLAISFLVGQSLRDGNAQREQALTGAQAAVQPQGTRTTRGYRTSDAAAALLGSVKPPYDYASLVSQVRTIADQSPNVQRVVVDRGLVTAQATGEAPTWQDIAPQASVRALDPTLVELVFGRATPERPTPGLVRRTTDGRGT